MTQYADVKEDVMAHESNAEEPIPTCSFADSTAFFEMKSTKVERRGGDAEPTYLKWAQGLEELLKDDTGCKLFQNYLEREDKDRYSMLHFLFACRGLSRMQPTEADRIAKIIFKMWFRKAHLKIGEEIREEVTRRFLECSRNNDLLSASIFNEAFNQVEKIMNTVAYPNFLQSDVFLAHVNDSQNLEEPMLLQTPCDHSYEKEDSLGPINYLHPQHYPSPRHQLPTLEENEELTVPLTIESLLRSETLRVTQRCRFPISDNFSSDGFKDGKKQTHQQLRRMRQMAGTNRVPDMPTFVPPSYYKWRCAGQHTVKREEFASILTSKLEMVIQQQEENKQRIEEKLTAVNTNPPPPPSSMEGNAKILRDVIMRRLMDDENDEDILDQHVSMVFKTPSRSPSLMTPILPKSPSSGDSKWNLPTSKDGQYDSGEYTGTSYSSLRSDSYGPCYNPCYEINFGVANGKYKTKSLMSCGTHYKNKTGQPFTQDLQMLLLPSPQTPYELDEAVRRLRLPQDGNAGKKMYNKNKTKNISSSNIVSKSPMSGSWCSQPSYRRPSTFGEEAITIAICRFSDENVPYSLKIPGNRITFRQFKDVLPKRGDYRYFFMCEDKDVGIIQEEITDDFEILPLWKDKINAQIKARNE